MTPEPETQLGVGSAARAERWRPVAPLGDRPLSDNTRSDYLWRLRGHLLPFFGPTRLDQIDREMCLEFKAQKTRESRDLRAAIAAGADLRDKRNRRLQPVGPATGLEVSSFSGCLTLHRQAVQ